MEARSEKWWPLYCCNKNFRNFHVFWEPSLKAAYASWKRSEREAKQTLFVENGVLEIGSFSEDLIQKALESKKNLKFPLKFFLMKESDQYILNLTFCKTKSEFFNNK